MRPLLVIGYPESIFKFALSGSFKNTFRRLPRLALARLAMTVKVSGSLKE
ncbi:MAG: hypothetical protein IKZ88_01785 [Neisseriaceae bacterium]|nr:hypothetical protein [Neisseriaceae bacterium]